MPATGNDTAIPRLGGRPPHTAPDALWPSDNEWGVPLLDPEMAATLLELPLCAWGSVARRSRMRGTWHFYVDDYKFSALWNDPQAVPRTRAVAVVEPNYSTDDQTPPAVALWAVYRKRWLARYWQSVGLRLLVDLNVAERFAEMNLLGVPREWSAYATRAGADGLAVLRRHWERAQGHSGIVRPLLVVCGGGRDVQAWCQSCGAVWTPDRGNSLRRGQRWAGAAEGEAEPSP